MRPLQKNDESFHIWDVKQCLRFTVKKKKTTKNKVDSIQYAITWVKKKKRDASASTTSQGIYYKPLTGGGVLLGREAWL